VCIRERYTCERSREVESIDVCMMELVEAYACGDDACLPQSQSTTRVYHRACTSAHERACDASATERDTYGCEWERSGDTYGSERERSPSETSICLISLTEARACAGLGATQRACGGATGLKPCLRLASHVAPSISRVKVASSTSLSPPFC